MTNTTTLNADPAALRKSGIWEMVDQHYQQRFNLKLVFATQGGSYLADVNVRIDDTRGNKLLDTVSDGPWLLVRMAPGRYRMVDVIGLKTIG